MAMLLYLIAVILAGLAAFGVAVRRVHFGWLAVALFIFTFAILEHIVD